jgi:ribosomal protein S18 acetylase RimI-like enzyme
MAPMPIDIHPFDPASTDEVLWLWRRSFEHGVGVIDPSPTLDGIKGYFSAEILPTHSVFVAKEQAQIVGVVAHHPESVGALYVRVDCIGRGIGSRLIDHAKAASSGSLWLYTYARNARARGFYAKHGFTEIAYGFEPFWKLDDVKLSWSAV